MRNLVIICLLLFIIPTSQAQNSKVTTGVVSYNNGDYDKALENLNIALENPSRLKKTNLPKAYYYRGKTNYKIFMKAVQAKESDILIKSPLLKILEDFQSAEKNDDGKWAKKIELEYQNLKLVLRQFGMILIQDKNFELARKHFSALNSIEEDYVSYDYLGQIKEAQKDYKGALENWDKCLDLFQSKRPDAPDMFIAYTCLKKAMIHFYFSGEYSEYDDLYMPTDKDINLAFASITEGKKLLEEEYKRTIEIETNDKTSVNNQYQSLYNELNNFELSLYLNSPEKLEEALVKFEKAIKEEPNNYIIHVSYANLLEKKIPSKAIEIYEKAISIDPNQEMAYYNLGAIYTNQSVEYYKQANEEDDFDAAGKLKKESDEYLKLAKPLFEKCLEINPQSLEVIRALKQISIRLEAMEDYNKYKEMEKRLE